MVRQALPLAAATLVLALPAGAARTVGGADTLRMRTGPTGTFKTPSGNIVCGYGASAIECGIKSGLRPPPAVVSCRAGDFTTKRVSLRATGRVMPTTCAGDPGPFLFESKAWVLGYGRTWSAGGITCSSATSGLTCRNRAGHGFFLSRERWRSF
jgi:Family of unknown function (DUF6636)